jgi:hypothetical protein
MTVRPTRQMRRSCREPTLSLGEWKKPPNIDAMGAERGLRGYDSDTKVINPLRSTP